ncbi:MAG: hypothetical protein QOI56_533, partial [Actinomycetota bacterium]|nr:hypothetical protein [Actinomycetota bacterium]
MGLCHEFGSQIRAGCGHPMRAGASACSCPECGVVCRGLFDGCPDVWARGPRPVAISATRAAVANGAPAGAAVARSERVAIAGGDDGPGPRRPAGGVPFGGIPVVAGASGGGAGAGGPAGAVPGGGGAGGG